MKESSFANIGQCRDDKVFDACGIAGFLNLDGQRENGVKVKRMISIMKDRENGLGGGFAVYGMWPEFQDQYCLQLILDNEVVKEKVEEYLKKTVRIIKDEQCSVGQNIQPAPLIWRFFIDAPEAVRNPDDYIVNLVMEIHSEIPGAFCLSSGKNMAVFKGVGWASEIADFYKIEQYKGFLWLGHSRFPTNTPGWWGGAHPFNILDYSVVHNGEITSYGTNRRYLEMWGYKCKLRTDTEVIAYLFDLLTRKQGLSKLVACNILTPPYYEEVARMKNGNQNYFKVLRMNYGAAMLNGPFSILVACNRPVPSLIGLTDRKKLRPLVAGISEDLNTVYMGSEESALRYVSPNLSTIWAPTAGMPVIAELGTGLVSIGAERLLNSPKIAVEIG